MAKKKYSSGNKYIDSLIDDVKPRKRKKLTRGQLISRLTVYGILWVVLLCSLIFAPQINTQMNHTEFEFDPAIAQGEYKVHFVDVGQGDCTLIELPDKKTMMIDNGKSSSKNNLMRYLDALNIKTLDYLILTHTDSDHIGNTVTLCESLDIKTAYVPKVYCNYDVETKQNKETEWWTQTTKIWSRTMEALYNEKTGDVKCEIIRSEAGIVIASDDDMDPSNDQYNFTFYTPNEVKYGEPNSYSPIILARLQGKKYLLTGDAPVEVEKEFLDHCPQEFYDVDVLKVGHHGSDTSTDPEFLSKVKPEIAVISCGKDNSYGHPKPSVMEKLENAKCKILRTDTMGSIVLNSSTDGISSGKIEQQMGYNHVSDTYLEWKNFVIVGGVILAVGWVFVIHTGKVKENQDEKDERKAS